MSKQRILSGVQPTSESMHLGNYLGAVKNWENLQRNYDTFFFVPDLHAFSNLSNIENLSTKTRLLVAQYIACGVDYQKSTIYIQSHIPQHAELAWILNCLTNFGEASRMTQFKSKSLNSCNNSSIGLFVYPMLMAADILLYRPHFIPVGEDQKQHIEMSRNLARRFNKKFGKTFIEPRSLILQNTSKIMDLQNPDVKMSKSNNSSLGLINILDKPDVNAKKIRNAKTDSKSEIVFDKNSKPGISNLMTIYSSLANISFEDISKQFSGKSYGYFKAELIDIVNEKLEPIRKHTFELMKDPFELDKIIANSSLKAKEDAEKTIKELYAKIGFLQRL